MKAPVPEEQGGDWGRISREPTSLGCRKKLVCGAENSTQLADWRRKIQDAAAWIWNKPEAQSNLQPSTLCTPEDVKAVWKLLGRDPRPIYASRRFHPERGALLEARLHNDNEDSGLRAGIRFLRFSPNRTSQSLGHRLDSKSAEVLNTAPRHTCSTVLACSWPMTAPVEEKTGTRENSAPGF